MKRYNSLFSLFSPGNRISVPVYGLAHLSYAEPERRHLDKLRKNRWVSEPLAGLCPVAVAVVAVALPFFPPSLPSYLLPVFILEGLENLMETQRLQLEGCYFSCSALWADGSSARLIKGQCCKGSSVTAFHSVPLGPACLHFS